jgi:hypothetical protein
MQQKQNESLKDIQFKLNEIKQVKAILENEKQKCIYFLFW